MRLYANHCKTFIEDCERNQIAEKLRTSFQLYAKNPSPSEFQSWQNSLRALALIFSRAGLTNQGVMLEFQLPTNSKRIDCLPCGFAKDGTPTAVAIELKQWQACEESAGDREVATFINGCVRLNSRRCWRWHRRSPSRSCSPSSRAARCPARADARRTTA